MNADEPVDLEETYGVLADGIIGAYCTYCVGLHPEFRFHYSPKYPRAFWLELAQKVHSFGLTAMQFFGAAINYYRLGVRMYPNMLNSAKILNHSYLKEFIAASKREADNLLNIQMSLMQQRAKVFGLESVLLSDNEYFTPLFRYAMGVQFNLPTVKERYRLEAKQEVFVEYVLAEAIRKHIPGVLDEFDASQHHG